MRPARPLALLLLLLLEAAPRLGALHAAGGVVDSCLQLRKDGLCGALAARYYYDRDTRRCRRLLSGDCVGSANSFETLEACDAACWGLRDIPKICQLEVHKVGCMKAGQRYYFNVSSMTCEKYPLGLCPHNRNEFPDKDTCLGYCIGWRAPSYCYTPKDEGLCSANSTRYYFNARQKACQPFTYTGCGGNENNFARLEDCIRVCEKASKKKRKRLLNSHLMSARRLAGRKSS